MIINGNAYSNSDCEFFIDGIPVSGVTNISFTSNRDYEQNYGLPAHSFNRGAGKISHEGSITLYNDELEALRNASATGFLFDIPPVDMVLVIAPIGKTPVTYTLKNVKMVNDGISTGSDSTSIETDITLNIGFIKYVQ